MSANKTHYPFLAPDQPLKSLSHSKIRAIKRLGNTEKKRNKQAAQPYFDLNNNSSAEEDNSIFVGQQRSSNLHRSNSLEPYINKRP